MTCISTLIYCSEKASVGDGPSGDETAEKKRQISLALSSSRARALSLSFYLTALFLRKCGCVRACVCVFRWVGGWVGGWVRERDSERCVLV
jgi:hypothetical protein